MMAPVVDFRASVKAQRLQLMIGLQTQRRQLSHSDSGRRSAGNTAVTGRHSVTGNKTLVAVDADDLDIHTPGRRWAQARIERAV